MPNLLIPALESEEGEGREGGEEREGGKDRRRVLRRGSWKEGTYFLIGIEANGDGSQMANHRFLLVLHKQNKTKQTNSK